MVLAIVLPMGQKPLRIRSLAGMSGGYVRRVRPAANRRIFWNLREVHTSLGYALHTVKPLDP
jgi:hypothetical protein